MTETEDSLAREVFERAIGNIPLPSGVRRFTRPAGRFSGDLILCRPSPAGIFHLLVGDFTGHGLSAALGALPTAQVFHTMSERGFALDEIVVELNRKLYTLLPPNLFLSAALLSYDPHTGVLGVWNCGLPPLLLFDRQGRIRQRLDSCNLPLGLTLEHSDDGCCFLEFREEDNLLTYSDGLVELGSGDHRFRTRDLEMLIATTPAEKLLEQIEKQVGMMLGECPPEDDITVVLLEGWQLPRALTEQTQPMQSEIDPPERSSPLGRLRLELAPPLLRRLDLAPLVTGILEEMGVRDRHRQAVFLILSELINNALEHGLLRLDSKLKRSASGFAEYMRLRQERLAQLTEGRIVVDLAYLDNGSRRKLEISVEDSGPGFDTATLTTDVGTDDLCGRGIPLLRRLCSLVEYQGRGNRVRVHYFLQ